MKCQILFEMEMKFWNGNAAYERLCVKYYASTQNEKGADGREGCGR